MATESFFQILDIEDDAAAERLLKAMEDTVSRKKLVRMDLSEERERGQGFANKRYLH